MSHQDSSKKAEEMYLRLAPQACWCLPWASLPAGISRHRDSYHPINHRGGLSIGNIASPQSHLTVEETEAEK